MTGAIRGALGCAEELRGGNWRDRPVCGQGMRYELLSYTWPLQRPRLKAGIRTRCLEVICVEGTVYVLRVDATTLGRVGREAMKAAGPQGSLTCK